MLKTGLEFISQTTVNADNTACKLGSGDMEVFATPAMIALMENAAMMAVAPHLEDGQSTVGTIMNVSHVKASGMGARIEAKALLQEIVGRKLVFHVSAKEGETVIGEGVHERFIVDRERFLSKLK